MENSLTYTKNGDYLIPDLTLSKEETAEIEWRFESLKPYLKPGQFDG